MTRASLLRAVTFSLPVALAACGAEPEPAPPAGSADEFEAVPFPTTHVLGAAALAAIAEVRDDGTVRLASDAPGAAALVPGHVLVAGISPATPRGLLRVIRAAHAAGGTTTLDTAPAPLPLAFRKLHVRATRAVRDLGGATPVGPDLRPLGGTGGATLPIDFYPFDADDDPSTTSDQMHVTGEVGGTYTYDLGIDVDWGDLMDLPSQVADCLAAWISGSSCDPEDLLPEVSAGYWVDGEIHANVRLEGAALVGFSRDWDVATVMLDPFAIGYLVFVPYVGVVAHVDGGASSRFGLGAATRVEGKAGVRFSSKSGAQHESPDIVPTSDWDPPAVTLDARAKASAGLRAGLLLYDVAGTWVGLDAWASLDARRGRSPCWQARAGATGLYGAELAIVLGDLGKVHLASTHGDFPVVDEPIASGACAEPEPGTSSLPPGGGPDAATLADPRFTPWARMYAGTNDGLAYSAGPGLRWTSITPTIDGDLLLAGSQSSALAKLDRDGRLVWAKRYVTGTGLDREVLRPVRAVQMPDFTVLVPTLPYGLLSIGQGGGVAWATALDVPHAEDGGPYGDDDHQQTFTSAIPDGAGGAWLAASWEPGAQGGADTRTLVAPAGADGAIARAFAIGAAGKRVYPAALLALDGDLFVTGLFYDRAASTSHGWGARVRPDGAIAWAREWSGCSETGSPELHPTTAIRAADGAILVAGSHGPYLRSFVAEVTTAGQLAFARSIWTGNDLAYFVIDDVRELPTTGFLVAGEYVPPWSADAELAIGALDASATPAWMRLLRLDHVARHEAFGASVHLTDRGGALFTAATDWPDGVPGATWAMETFAKDGAVALDPARVAVTSFAPEAEACGWIQAPLALAVEHVEVPARSVAVTAEAVDVTATSLGP